MDIFYNFGSQQANNLSKRRKYLFNEISFSILCEYFALLT